MKVIIALDSFKGSISAINACAAVYQGIKQVCPKADILCVPISDGGEGLIEALEPTLKFRGFMPKEIEVTGPYQQRVNCRMLMDDNSCIIEMAQCSGLELQPSDTLHAMDATSYGLGEAVIYALNQGCRDFKIGLGGSATNDGGAGFAQALGVRFYDKAGVLISHRICGRDLINIGHIDLDNMNHLVYEANFFGTCDVNNPLLGPKGATAIFGAQKGASDNELKELETGMNNYSQVLKTAFNRDLTNIPGAGAAGGMGAGLLYFTKAKLHSGIKVVLQVLNLEDMMNDCSLVIVGEGRMDGQSAQGKAPAGVAELARAHNIPVVALCGSLGHQSELMYSQGIDAMFSICNHPMNLEDAMKRAHDLLKSTAENVMRLFICAYDKRLS